MVKKVENANKNDLYYISKNIVSPVLISYTLWLLKTAKSRGISTLYVLARDGYVLREIALQLSKKYDFDIDCRYLYCSRAALRSASFHLADQEGMNLLFYHSNHVTLSSLFQRMNMPSPRLAVSLRTKRRPMAATGRICRKRRRRIADAELPLPRQALPRTSREKAPAGKNSVPLRSSWPGRWETGTSTCIVPRKYRPRN